MPSSRLVQPASRELVTDVTSTLHTATMLCAISVTVLALTVAAFDELSARRFVTWNGEPAMPKPPTARCSTFSGAEGW